MSYIGLDVHKKDIEVAIVDSASSKLKKSFRLKTDLNSLKGFAKTIKSTDVVALESTTNAFPIAEILKISGAKVYIGNPMKTKMIAESKVKTDKIDAETIARLLAIDYLPTIWQPNEELQNARKLTSYCNALGKQRTMAKNRIHSILHRNLIQYSEYSDLFSKKGKSFLQSLDLQKDEKFQLEQELALLDYLENTINLIKKRIAHKAIADEDVLRLMTIPGIDYYIALSIKSAIGDIKRFNNPRKLVSYFGLNPSVSQSGDKRYDGSITKQGRSHARWVLSQAAQCIVKSPGPLKIFFLRIKSKKGRNTAIIAVAAKLTRIIWHMLTKKEDYYFSPPLRTKEKLANLRIIATGKKLQGGLKKGEKSKGGRKTYVLLRKTDKDKAIQAEAAYKQFLTHIFKSQYNRS